jgi:hypothetical protein
VRWNSISPSWLTMQRAMVRACRSIPQYNGCCLVSHRLRSPPLLWYFPSYQHTTVVCGGGGLTKYQPAQAQRSVFAQKLE